MTLKAIFLLVVAGYALVAVAMFFGQRRLMYRPDPEHVAPADAGLAGVEEVSIATPDGNRIIAWYARARPGQPTLLYFHGNAGSLASRSERIRKYASRGRGLFMMSYRGYSGSSGTPSESANVADARLGYEALVKGGIMPADIIIYGESLGSGVAVQLAAEKPVGGLILDAPYTSLVDVAAGHYPWLPVRPMLLDRYDSMRVIGRVRSPLLVIHGEQDVVIPVAMGRALYAQANAPKDIVTFPEAGHTDHILFGSYEAINNWIERLRAGASAAGDPKAAN
ncbi:MAG: alpha/beta fold hydrolase [Hyphomicrobium sp.]